MMNHRFQNKIHSSLVKKNESQKLTILSNELEIEKTNFRIVKRLLLIQKKLLEGKLTFDYGGRPVRALPADIVRVISQSDTSSELEECIKNMFLNAIISLEKRSIFSGNEFLKLFSQERHEKETYRLRATKEDILHLVSKNIGVGICYEIFSSIFENAGLFTDLNFIETNSLSNFEIKMSGGKRIKGDIDMIFSGRPKSIENAYVLFFDGVLEKVSEIHHILESSSQENRPVVIFAHGFSPDVSNTLSKNYKSGVLNVIPFVVSDKEKSWETFEKSNYFTVRRENFREISMVSLEEVLTVKEISFGKSDVVIYDETIDNIKTTIFIPKHFKNQAALIEDRIRSSFEYSKDIAKHGVVLDSMGKPKASIVQRKTSLKTYETFSDFRKNLGCIVVHSR